MNCTLIRYAEISLKGKNRTSFEKALQTNISDAVGSCRVTRVPGRIILEGHHLLDNIFGISSYSPTIKTSSDDVSIGKAIDEVLLGKSFTSFRISCRRTNIEGNSLDMNRKFGSYVQQKYSKKVSLQDYDINIGIEIMGDDCFVFTQKIPGAGGLPVGVSGKVIVAAGENAELAARMMMKRGCNAIMADTSSIDELERIAAKRRAKAIIINTCSLDKMKKGKVLLLRPLIGTECT